MPKTLIRRLSLLQTSCLMIALGLPSWQLASAQQTVFGGERVVHLLDEPHHRPVRQHGQLYLLDIRPKHGDKSLTHVRARTILLTYISLAGGPQNAHIGVYIDFASVPLNHKVSNVEPSRMEWKSRSRLKTPSSGHTAMNWCPVNQPARRTTSIRVS